MTSFRPQYASIKGISDRRRLPRLGKIRLGIKKKSEKTGNEYPSETSYFVCPPEVEAVYGSQPTELDVMLCVNEREVVFPQAYKWYGKSKGAKCTGDGETAMRMDEETGKYSEIQCPCEKLESGECSQRGHLMVMLPAVNVGGVYQIDVGSYNSIVDVNSGIDYVQAMLGRFAMVPLKLKRVPRETHYEGKKATHYTLHLHLDATIDTLNTLKQDTVRILTGPTYALPAPEDMNPELDNAVVDVVDEEPPPEPEEKPKAGNDKTLLKKGSSIAIALEQAIKDASMDRNKFKELLQKRKMIAPDKDGKLSMYALTHKQAEQLLDKWENVSAAYDEYMATGAELSEPISLETIRMLNQLISTRSKQSGLDTDTLYQVLGLHLGHPFQQWGDLTADEGEDVRKFLFQVNKGDKAITAIFDSYVEQTQSS